VNGRDLSCCAEAFEDRDDARNGVFRQRRHVLAKVYGEIGFPVMLVSRDSGARHFRKNGFANGFKGAPVPLALFGRLRIASYHDASRVIVTKVEGTVLSDHAVHRPLTGDEIAPASRPTCDRYNGQARFLETRHGAVRRRR